MKITLDKSDIDAAILAHLAAMGLSGFTEIEWSRYSSPDFVTLSKPEAIDVEPPFPPPPRTGRISAKEWGVINAILNGSYAEARAVLAEIEYTVENIQSCQQEQE